MIEEKGKRIFTPNNNIKLNVEYKNIQFFEGNTTDCSFCFTACKSKQEYAIASQSGFVANIKDGSFSTKNYAKLEQEDGDSYYINDLLYSPLDNRYYIYVENLIFYFSAEDEIPNFQIFMKHKGQNYEGMTMELSDDKENLILNEEGNNILLVNLRTKVKYYLLYSRELRNHVSLENSRALVVQERGQGFIIQWEKSKRKVLFTAPIDLQTQTGQVLALETDERDRCYSTIMYHNPQWILIHQIFQRSIELRNKILLEYTGSDYLYCIGITKFEPGNWILTGLTIDCYNSKITNFSLKEEGEGLSGVALTHLDEKFEHIKGPIQFCNLGDEIIGCDYGCRIYKLSYSKKE